MRTQPQTVVTLSNNKKYIVVDTITSGKTEYAYLLGEEDKKPVFTFCTEVIEDDKVFLQPVTDDYLIKKLATLFSNDLQEQIEAAKKNDDENK